MTNVEVDQSNKFERAAKDTTVAFSNDISGSALMPAKEKRKVKQRFRGLGKPKIFVYQSFAVLIFIALKPHLKEIDRIVIDTEYPGKDNLIRELLLREIRQIRQDFSADKIVFQQIGKKSKAHYLAHGVTTKRIKAGRVVKAEEVLKFLLKQKSGI